MTNPNEQHSAIGLWYYVFVSDFETDVNDDIDYDSIEFDEQAIADYQQYKNAVGRKVG